MFKNKHLFVNGAVHHYKLEVTKSFYGELRYYGRRQTNGTWIKVTTFRATEKEATTELIYWVFEQLDLTSISTYIHLQVSEIK